MKFKRKIWFISDMHFYHDNIIDYCDRPFKNVHDMNEEIIKQFNKYVGKDDLVYDLGDTIWSTGDLSLLKRLNGRKILIKGNHDKDTNKYVYIGGYIAVIQEAEIMIGKNRVRLSHYPYRFRGLKHAWTVVKNYLKGDTKILKHFKKRPVETDQWLIRGHTHGTEKYSRFQVNVGWDAWHRPVNIQEIESIIQRQYEDDLKKKTLTDKIKGWFGYVKTSL